jgi:hypothetical protein
MASQQNKSNGGSSAKPGAKKSTGPQKKGDPAFWLITKKQVAFTRAARAYSEALTDEYGDQISISKFEAALAEIRGNSSLKDIVHLSEEIFALRGDYHKALEERREERDRLRKGVGTPKVPQQIDNVDDVFRDSSKGEHKDTADGQAPPNKGVEQPKK